MENNRYKLDRTKFKMQSFKEADYQYNYWKAKSVEDRLLAANYLISTAWNFTLDSPPKMDRTKFSTRKHSF